jgi:D-alanine-D-alanine ligase
MTKRKIRVGIIFGGKSGEHEVSLRSAQSVMRAIDKDKYEVVPIGIGIDGGWLTRGDPLKTLTGGAASMPQLLKSGYAIDETPIAEAEPVDSRRTLIPGTQDAGIPQIDVIFPVLHGPYGEDGAIQGLLEMADVPYVGAGVMSSALAMDKAIMRNVLRSHGLPVVKDLLVKRVAWQTQPDRVRAKIAEAIGYPCFVKPANLGSSVGVSKAHTANEIDAALNLAASYDRKILVEYAVPEPREIEVSVLGNDEPIASVPGEVAPDREFYDYESKYSDESTSELLIPAPLDAELAARIRQLAIETYLAFDCAGMARVDFLLSRTTNELYVSEANTIPGFTSISMYPKLWEATGISYGELIDRLIELALDRHEDKRRSRVRYEPGRGQ